MYNLIIMTNDDFTYKPQDVNYLGFLEAQLRDLTGIDTLTYELIQNADDVKDENGRFPITKLSFNVTDEALIVENNGVFRAVDFERLQNLAGGGKREEANTTGAFGIGFIAVYQITDAPEIFSNGLHWTIRPDAAADHRIEERQVETEGTCFRLPWAFDVRSPIRRALRIEAVQPEQLDSFAESVVQAVQTAALFLRKLKVLEVKRNGRLLQRIKRLTPISGEIILENLTSSTTWLLIQGNFAEIAKALREQFPWQIEESRRSEVKIAIPISKLDQQGRLFAGLPTDSVIPLPLHINADFYPTTDRKRIHFGKDYQAEWNRAAIRCASDLLASHFELLSQQLGPFDFWELIHKIAYADQLAQGDELPKVFATFWDAIAPLLHDNPILFTADEQWLLPSEVRLPGRNVGETAVSLLNQLHIPILHPDLNSHSQLMQQPEIGALPLSIHDVIVALQEAGLVNNTSLLDAPSFLQGLDRLQTLWQLIDKLLIDLLHPQDLDQALADLQTCALLLTESMMLENLNHVFSGRADAMQLFPDAGWLHESIPLNSFPGKFVKRFGVRQAVDMLKEMPFDQLEYAWRMGRLDVPGIFRWLESNQIEIFADDPTLQQEIRRLPLVPVDGELRPLSHLFIPGGFSDPLNLSGTVDMEAVGGRPQFLSDLGVQALDFETYLYEQLPRVLSQNHDIPSDAHHKLVHLLAQRLGEFRDDYELQAQFADLPLIACMDGMFWPANVVYASRDVQKILGDRVNIAEPVESASIRALHRWLGVRTEPAAADIVQSLLSLSRKFHNLPLDELTQKRVWLAQSHLNALLSNGQASPTELASLLDKPVLPNRRGKLAKADALFVGDQHDLISKFIDIDDYLLFDGEGVEMITAVFNIQPLSQAVNLQVNNALDGIEAEGIQTIIANRRPLIDRILQADTGQTAIAEVTAFLDTIRVFKLPMIEIQYLLTVDNNTFKTEPETVAVKYDQAGNIFYIEEKFTWVAIARELAVFIKQNQAVGGLAIGIKEVLAANSYGSAARILDDLGYL